LQSEMALFPPTGIILSPVDYRAAQLEKSTIGTYLGGGPWSSGGTRLWNTPVATSLSMPAGSFMVGAFGLAAQIFDREEAQIYLSTETNDAFIRNQVYVLCEERLALTVQRPEALIYGQFSHPTG
jgi:HK97 family phage major capsid protein